jgi:pyruvate/2-oxoglutarate dehydrogenase complex dihydrolipoamide acyltransferase (E2) component
MNYKLVVPGPVEDVEEVRVLEWHGAARKAFAPGELIVELETHKAVVEVRAGQNAVLRKILCKEGSWLKIGDPLALLSDSETASLPPSPEGLDALAVEFEIL